MTADGLPSAQTEPPVRLVVLGDAASAPVCDGDVCYLPPDAATAATSEPDESDPPQ